MCITTKNCIFFCMSNELNPECPSCHCKMIHYDSRKRIIRRLDGKISYIILRRMYCKHCKKLHLELPNFLIPRKQYAAKFIQTILNNAQNVLDVYSNYNYPSDVTKFRWMSWYKNMLSNLFKSIKDLGISALSKFKLLLSQNSLLSSIKKLKYKHFLFLIQIYYKLNL